MPSNNLEYIAKVIWTFGDESIQKSILYIYAYIYAIYMLIYRLHIYDLSKLTITKQLQQNVPNNKQKLV